MNNKTARLSLIILFIVISICITVYSYKSNKAVKKDYVQTTAVITNSYPARVAKRKVIPARYDILFLDKNGKEQQVFRVALGNDYQPNDTVMISYNPKNVNEVKPLTSN